VVMLQHSRVLPITVIDFPHGKGGLIVKRQQAFEALEAGARELDMVLTRVWLHERNYKALHEEIVAVVNLAQKVPVKVILETSELDDLEKIAACVIAKCAGASYVKTSTGFSKTGATEEDVRLMRKTVGSEMGVKASGGIRTYPVALRMLRAGANRLGTSASVAIVRGGLAGEGNY